MEEAIEYRIEDVRIPVQLYVKGNPCQGMLKRIYGQGNLLDFALEIDGLTIGHIFRVDQRNEWITVSRQGNLNHLRDYLTDVIFAWYQ